MCIIIIVYFVVFNNNYNCHMHRGVSNSMEKCTRFLDSWNKDQRICGFTWVDQRILSSDSWIPLKICTRFPSCC